MKNDFYVAQRINIDPSSLREPSEQLKIVSFRIEVLDKYQNDSSYIITLNNNVGILQPKSVVWKLKIDVHNDCAYVNTWLYQLADLPDSEQEHFASHNIYARELSPTAYNRWVEGEP